MQGNIEAGWWDERLRLTAALGYDTSGIAEELRVNPDRASERLEQFERHVDLAETLRMNLVRLPSHWEAARSEWLPMLDDPSHAPMVEREFRRMQLTLRPWGLEYDAHKREWERAGRLDILSAAVDRLDALDSSLVLESNVVCAKMANPSRADELRQAVDDLEGKQADRVAKMREMADLLSEQGFAVTSVFEGGLSRAAERLEEVSKRASSHHALSALIETEISPYDKGLAEMFEQRRLDLQTQNRAEESELLMQIETEVETVAGSFRSRLARLHAKLLEWTNQGMILPLDETIPPEDLLVWEMRMPEFEQAVAAHESIWERAEKVLAHWPEEWTVAESLKGDLERLEELVSLVESLEQQTKNETVEGSSQMEHWSDLGFSMAMWRMRFDEDPRAALQAFKAHIPFLEEVRKVVESIEKLDLSMGDERVAESYIQTLRDAVLEIGDYEEAQTWLEVRRRRNLRHRVMLEEEWRKLVSKGRVDGSITTAELSLSHFEELIAEASGGLANDEAGLGADAAMPGIASRRLSLQLTSLIDDWSALGWECSGLRRMLRDEPMTLGRRLDSIRAQMDDHASLRSRLEALPWERSPELVASVDLELRRPEMLEALRANLPSLATQLASKPLATETSEWKAWAPRNQPRPILMPSLEEVILPPPTLEIESLEAALAEMVEVGDVEEVEEETSLEAEVEEDETPEVSDQTDEDEVVAEEIAEIILESEGDTQSARQEEPEQIDDQASVDEDEPQVISEPEDEVVTKQPVVKEITEGDEGDTVDWPAFGDAVSTLCSTLGLTEEVAGLDWPEGLGELRRMLASNVGLVPRDVRVDRMLRILLRTLPPADSQASYLATSVEIIERLELLAKVLTKWTRERLDHRQLGSTNYLLEDSLTLGVALQRIPGPGVPIPLDADELGLPSAGDMESLNLAVGNLERAVKLPPAGMVVVASA